MDLKGKNPIKTTFLVRLISAVSGLLIVGATVFYSVPLLFAAPCTGSGTDVTISSACEFSAGTYTYSGTFTIASGVTVTTSGAVEIIADSIDIQGTLTGDEAGYAAGNTSAPGYPTSNSYSGAGHGGDGGDGYSGAGGVSYGSVTNPTTLGSGNYYSAGGGAIKLTANGTGTINIDGTVSANGGYPSSTSGGGGAGGSIWINAPSGTIDGTGTISANGGDGYLNNSRGGGGGGRIAIYNSTDNSTWTTQAYGGDAGNTSYQRGGAGSIYKKSASATNGDLTINNGPAGTGYRGDTTQVTTALQTYDNIEISGASNYTIPSANSLTLASGGTFNTGSSEKPKITVDGVFDTSASTFTFQDINVDNNGQIGTTTNLTLNNCYFNHQGSFSNAVTDLTFATGTSGSTFLHNGDQMNDDDIVVGNSGTFILQATPRDGFTINSLTVQDTGTFEQRNVDTANIGTLTVNSGGKLTHALNTGFQDYSLRISSTNIDIQSGALIDIEGKGYAEDNTNAPGYSTYSGSSHAGIGGQYSGYTPGGVYGSVTQPTTLGSGNYYRGGGGSVKFTASGTFTLNGTIDADAQDPDIDSYYSGGSGGSVWIDAPAGTITGSGTITADGGNGNRAGGGGGRIAVYYNSNTGSFLNNLQAYGGDSDNAAEPRGGAGSIYVKSATATNGDLTISDANEIGTHNETIQTETASQTFDNIAISNGAIYTVPDTNTLTLASGGSLTGGGTDQAKLKIDSGGTFEPSASSFTFQDLDVLNNGNINSITDLTLNNSDFEHNGSLTATITDLTFASGSAGSRFTHNGLGLNDQDITIGNSGTFKLEYTSPTVPFTINSMTVQNTGTFEQSNLETANIGTLTVNSGGTLTHTLNTGVKAYTLDINSTNIDIQSGATVALEGKGYAEDNASAPGYSTYSGSSHAGTGGQYSSYVPGGVYGSVTQPTDPGSGNYHRAGGGAAKLTASGTLTLNGTIDADASDPLTDSSYGGGAGGSVWLNAPAGTITGNGTITANGGNGNRAGGGGGRIAIYYNANTGSFLNNLQAYQGNADATSEEDGGAGSIYIMDTANDTNGDLIITAQSNTGSIDNTIQTETASQSYDSISVQNGAKYIVPDTFTLSQTSGTSMVGAGSTNGSLRILTGATLNLPSTGFTFQDINVINNGNINTITDLTLNNSTFDHNGSFPATVTDITFASGTNGSTFIQDGTGFNDQDIVITNNGTFVLEEDNPLAPFTINSLTVQDTGTFEQRNLGTANIDTVTVNSGGTLTHTVNDGAKAYVLDINSTNIDIQSGATVDIEGKGYAQGNSSAPGYSNYSGATHAGQGGQYSSYTNGSPYGSATQPTSLGSGNNYRSGGGAAKLTASGTLILNGTIDADASDPLTDSSYGAGAGGSVWINAPTGTITGTGSITANGGNGDRAGGGGGRIAVYYNSNTGSFLDTLQAYNGDSDGSTEQAGGTGSIYIMDSQTGTNGDLIIEANPGVAIIDNTIQTDTLSQTYDNVSIKNGAKYIIPDTYTLALTAGGNLTGGGVNQPSLTIESGGTLTLPDTNIIDPLTFNNSGTFSISGDMSVTDNEVAFDGGISGGLSSLTVGNNGIFRYISTSPLFSGSSLIIENGGTFVQENTTTIDVDTLQVDTGGLLTHSDNSSTKSAVVDFLVTDALINGDINVDYKGYDSTTGTGEGGDGAAGGGAGHGGDGGDAYVSDVSQNNGGSSYGNPQNPLDLGSGGGDDTDIAGQQGGSGGGAIKISAGGTITVNGTISAKGENARDNEGGGGAGGSILLDTNIWAGTGTIDVSGGLGGGDDTTGGGCGAGGRASAYFLNSKTFTGDQIVDAGCTGLRGAAEGTFIEGSDASPAISSIVPDAGLTTGGESIIINGSNFDNYPTNPTVTVGGQSCTNVVYISSTQLTCTTPAGTVSQVDVIVTNPDTESASSAGTGWPTTGFRYFEHPTVTNVTPNQGQQGTTESLTVTGTGFIDGMTTAKISKTGESDISCTSLVVNSGTELTCDLIIPTGIAKDEWDFSVTVYGTWTDTLTDEFTVIPPAPVVTEIIPSSGPTTGNIPIIINGDYFYDGTGADVTFGGVSATNITVVNEQTITCTLPANSEGTVDVIVTNPYSETDPAPHQQFTYETIYNITDPANFGELGIYYSPIFDSGSSSTIWDYISWSESGVTPGNGETPFDSTGLFSQWNFNETRDPTASNSAGTGSCGGTASDCNGTLTNFTDTSGQDVTPLSGWTDVNKKWGNGALMFDGVDDYIDLGTSTLNTNLNGASAITFEGWINPHEYTTDNYGNNILTVNISNNYWGYAVNIDATNGNVLMAGGRSASSDSYQLAVSKSAVPLNKWTYFVATLDYQNDKIIIYINGKLETEETISFDSETYVPGSSTVSDVIGQYGNDTYFYDGSMDGLRLYTRALTADEVLANYNVGNIEIQTRTGQTANANDGTWEEWRPANSVESGLSNFDNNAANWLFDNTVQAESTILKLDESTLRTEGSGSMQLVFGGQPASANTIGFWRFEETGGSGAYIKDLSGNGYDGTPQNTNVTDGYFGKARQFTNALDSNINIGDNIEGLTDMTEEAWIYLEGIPTETYSDIDKKDLVSGFSIYKDGSDNLYINANAGDGTTWGTGCNSASTLDLNNWYHVAAVFSGTNVSIYINGKLDQTCSIGQTVGSNTNDRIIGMNGFYGIIDELLISNIAKDYSAIQASYRSGRGHKITSESGGTVDFTNVTKIFFDAAIDTYVSPFARYETDENTVGFWKMEENAGKLYDYSGNNNIATASNADPADGQVGSSRYFNGSNAYLQIEDSPSLDLTDAMTIDTWIYPTSTNSENDRVIVKTWDGNTSPWSLYALVRYPSEQRYKCDISISGTGYSINMPSGMTIPLNEWSHLACTYESGRYRIYVNGQIANERTDVTGSIDTNNRELTIARNTYGREEWGGYIDESRISNLARSEQDIYMAYLIGSKEHNGSALTATIGESAYTNYEPDANTLALWHLEEENGTGAYIKDDSGNSLDSTPTEAQYDGGYIGGARYFDGSNDKITINDTTGSPLDVTNNLTLEAWVYPTLTDSDWDRIIEKSWTTDIAPWNVYALHRVADTQKYRMNVSVGGTEQSIDSVNEIPLYKWSYIVGTYDGNSLKIYINGKLENETNLTGSIDTNDMPVVIGGRSTSTNHFFQGKIDEVRISDVARTTEEIRHAYQIKQRTLNINPEFKTSPATADLTETSPNLALQDTSIVIADDGMIENIDPGERIIIKENYDGTEYLAQATVQSVNTGTNTINIRKWEGDVPEQGTAVCGGVNTYCFSPNATIFKWQRIYWDLSDISRGSGSGDNMNPLDAIDRITYRTPNGAIGKNVYLDNLVSVENYLTDPSLELLNNQNGRYAQYRAILTSVSNALAPTLNSLTLNYKDGTVTPPNITSVSPDIAAPDTAPADIAITGNNFQAGATVTLSRLGETDITATGVNVTDANNLDFDLDLTGAANGYWDITIENPDSGKAYLEEGFNINTPSPVITSITDDYGYNTEAVKTVAIQGSYFQSGITAKLTLDGQSDIACTNYDYSGLPISGTFTCELNLNGAEVDFWNVRVTNPDNQSDVLTDGFEVRYNPPSITDVDPFGGSTLGGTEVTITGDYFLAGDYMREITILNTEGAQTDYQVSFTLDTATLIGEGKMRGDAGNECGDLRVYDTDQATELPYWIEPGTCNTASTIIWTKVPNLEASPATTSIYVGYGNDDFTSQSNLNNVFIRELNGLAGYWKMDETVDDSCPTGDDLCDETSNANHAYTVNGTSITNGKFGNARNFIRSSDQYVRQDTVSADLTNTAQTYAAWIRPTDTSRGTAFGFHTSSGGNLNILFWSSSSSGYYSYYDGTDKNPSTSTPTNEWHFYTATLGSDNTLKQYIDGTDLYTGSSSTRPNSDGRFSLGQEWDGSSSPSDFFQGDIDEMMLFNGELTQPEIQDLADNYPFMTSNYPDQLLIRKWTGQTGSENLEAVSVDSIGAEGPGLYGSPQVQFDGIDATNITYVDPNTLTAVTPAHAAGAVDVTVINPDSQSATLTDGYTYSTPPTITSVNPISAIMDTTVTGFEVNGTDFQSLPEVRIISGATTINCANETFVDSTQVTCDLDLTGATAGTYDVTLTNPDSQVATLTDGFEVTYPAPTISSIVPNEGPETGGTSITITGTDFRGSAYGTGSDGAVTISTNTNLSTDIIATGRTCADAINYSVSSLTSNSATLSETPAARCIEEGDQILLINQQGTETSSVNTGNYEILNVASVVDDTITFNNEKTKFYGDGATDDTNIGTGSTNQKVMIQRVPQYSNVTIDPGVTLTAGAWDGTKGGILYFKANGTVTNNGTIDMNAKGFRGGVAAVSGPEASTGFTTNGGGGGGGGGGGHDSGVAPGGSGADGAEDGETSNGSRNAGGDGITGGGGGGAGGGWAGPDGGGGGGDGDIAGLGGDGGAVEGEDGINGGGGGAAGAGRDSAGGGGGGSAYDSATNNSDSALTALQLGGGASAGAGGGGGGASGDYCDAGGGSGGSKTGAGGANGSSSCTNDSTAGNNGDDGNAGGGIIFIQSPSILNNGTMESNGGDGGTGGKGGDGSTYSNDGGGGGGGGGGNGASGGSILFKGSNIDLSGGTVAASPGTGGSGGLGGAHYQGGDGAAGDNGTDGVVAVYYEDTLTGTTSPIAYEEQGPLTEGGSIQVQFDGISASGIQLIDSTTIIATTPPGTPGQVDVTVVNPDDQSDTSAGSGWPTTGFRYNPGPSLTSITPDNGTSQETNKQVTIIGDNFVDGITAKLTHPTAPDIECTPVGPTFATIYMSPTELFCQLDLSGTLTGRRTLIVENPDGQTANLSDAFTINPAITEITPNSGSTTGRTSVTINGSSFTLYQYRRPIDLTNSAGQLTDHQVKITVDTSTIISSGKMQNDCSDIRIKDTNSVTNLNYWIEPGTCNTAETAIWTKVPVIAASPDSTRIYITYGDSSLSDASDKANVFISEIDSSALQGHWHLDQTSGTTVPDSSGNVITANTVNSPTWETGKFNNAINLNGSNQYIDVPYDAALAPTSEISFGAWAHQDDWNGVSSAMHILSKTESGGYQLRANGTNGLIEGLIHLNGSYQYVDYPMSSLSSGWHHFMVTYDGQIARLYADGTEVDSLDMGAPYPIHYQYNNSLFISGEPNSTNGSTGNYYTGKIDEPMILNRALTGPEITNIANNYAYSTPNNANSLLIASWSDDPVTEGAASVQSSVPGSESGIPYSVTFDGLEAKEATYVNNGQLTVLTPPHATGTVDVTVTNPDLTSATSSGASWPTEGYQYNLPAPVVSSIVPNSGPETISSTVTINGDYFASTPTVTFGGTPAASVTFIDSTELTVQTPTGVTGTVDIIVTNPDTQSDTAPHQQFTFNPPPDATTIDPITGSANQTHAVTITGTGFQRPYYSTPLTIDNTLGSALTDYQVLVTVDTATLISEGKMRGDAGNEGGDIRFYDSDGVTSLDYWIESGINTASTQIWVEVPSIPDADSKTIYMTYGDTSLTSASNPQNTMIWYDDFEDAGTQSMYIPVQLPGDNGGQSGPGTCTISGGILQGDTSNDSYGCVIDGISLDDLAIKADVRSNGDNDTAGLVFRYNSFGNAYGSIFSFGDTGWGATTALVNPDVDSNEGWLNADGVSNDYGTVSQNTWHTMEAKIWGSDGATKGILTVDGTEQCVTGGCVNTINNTPYQNSGQFGVWTALMDPSADWDNLVVRKYTENEPTVTVGTEQGSGSALQIDFEGTPATDVVYENSTTIYATAPALSSGIYNVTITNPDGQSDPTPVTFEYIGVTNADNSTFTATPLDVMADGISNTLLTATLLNETSSPVEGATVNVTATGPNIKAVNCQTADVGVVTPGVSNENGQACFLATSSSLGTNVEFIATDTTNSTEITQRAYVNFVNCIIDKDTSTFDASKAQVASDGADSADLTVHLVDYCGLDVTKENVVTIDDNSATTTTYTPPGSTPPQTYTTDGTGQATTAVSSLTAGAVTFDAGLNEEQYDTSTYVEDPSIPNEYNGSGTLIAGSDNQDDTEVTFNMPFDFTLYDQTVTAGNPVYLCTNGFLSLSSSGCPASGALTNAIAGFHSDLLTTDGGIYQRSDADSITFIWDARADSTFDGIEPIRFEIKLYRNNRMEIHYETAETINSKNVGLYNNASVALSSLLSEPHTNKATKFEYDTPVSSFDLTDHPQIQFLAGEPEPANSTVIADPIQITANGSDYSTITVTVLDSNSNPISARDIQLDQNGDAVITQVDCTDLVTPDPGAQTDSNGEACYNVTDTLPQTVTFTATDITELPIILGSDDVEFGCVTGPNQQCVQVSVEEGAGAITMSTPESFNFLSTSTGATGQTQFTCDDLTECPDNATGYTHNVNDLIEIVDTRNNGGFTVQVQASTPFESASGAYMPFQNFFVATTPASTGGTQIDGIEYDDGYSGLTCSGTPLNTTGSLLDENSFLFNFGSENIIPSTIHDLMECELGIGEGRTATMKQNVNYSLQVPPLQPTGTYSVILTYDLII